jgi:pimeloyl-ACP methyl ester carboxylesterase
MACPKPTFLHDGLAIYAFGAGAPLFLMPHPHGASVVGDLAPTALIDGLVRLGRRVITFDPPGAGRSTRSLRLTLAEMLDCTEESLGVCGVPGAVDVMGHSQGALAALAFTIERPRRVRRLILVGAAAGGPSYLHAPGAIWNRSHAAFWHFGLVALVLWLTRRRAAQQMMLNTVTRASYADPTRAITINAPAGAIWQWLIQVGQDRGGFYSYDWLENIFGTNIHTTNVVRPEWQERATGEKVPLMPSGFLGSPPYYGPRAIVDPGRSLILTQWGAFVLQPIDGQTTRLIVRDRASATNLFNRLIFDPLVFAMEAREMRGIKARAGGTPNPLALLDIPARLGWAVAGVVAAGLFLRQHGARWLWLLAPVAATIPALALARDPDAALAAFLAVGIILLGFLYFGRRWWGPFSLLGSAVMLTLLLTPNAYLAFGWALTLVVAGGLAFVLVRQWKPSSMRHLLRHPA